MSSFMFYRMRESSSQPAGQVVMALHRVGSAAAQITPLRGKEHYFLNQAKMLHIFTPHCCITCLRLLWQLLP
jgi:hypothetical protein